MITKWRRVDAGFLLLLPYGWHYAQLPRGQNDPFLWVKSFDAPCRYRSSRLGILLVLLIQEWDRWLTSEQIRSATSSAPLPWR